ncbi:hypothetical protein [Roseovarius autotrophicus]|uniref:hypothetical protein n=1 Tax=Roseovarius autotrophicus TaxID=2824121 RepID=UPI001B35CD42|nr:hypothetical protein [Roseovarius autotrophicus]
MTITTINLKTGERVTSQNDAPSFVTPAEVLAQERGSMVASAMQVRLALLAAGRLDEVEAIVAAADTATQIAWDKATEFRRLSPTIAAFAALASPPFSDEDLDALFTAAMEIEV